MKKILIFIISLFLFATNSNAETYLISSQAIKEWASVWHNGKWFTTGVNAFPDFETLLAVVEENSTIYVADGTYSDNITISKNGLTLLGNNAYNDWSASRKNESIITGTINIKASNVTINGFFFTENGRIQSTSATNANPLSGIKVLHNYFTQSTLTRGAHNAVVKLGEMITNANVNNISSQCRYKDCEVSHNYFEGDATHYPNCIGIGGAFGTTTILDNYFYDGGTSIHMANAQGTLNIKYNTFKNVGKTTFTAPDGGNKGDFCIAIYRSAFANSTTANIVANEFNNCYGQSGTFSLIRIFHGSGTSGVMPVNYRVNINDNTFKSKTSVYPNASEDLGGSNFLLYHDDDIGKDVRFNISGNHYDNRFYKLSWVTLDDGLGMREIFVDQISRFYHACMTNKMSSWTSSLTGTDVANHVIGLELDDVSVLQSFDIDPLTGDMYFSQLMPTARNNAYNSLHGLPSNHDGIVITRVPCTGIDGYNYTYSTDVESMEIGYGGHGTNICTVRDKNGELWIWGGGNASVNDGNDKSATTARFKFKKGTDLNLNVSNDTENIKIFNVSGAGNEYPACDETSRYLCVYTTTTDVHTYSIYDLDDALEGKQTLLKKVDLNVGDYARSTITNDNGYATWYIQGFDINGDHLYIYEGSAKGEEGNINSTDPTIVLTCYNWRTNTYVYRAMIYDDRFDSAIYGEPEGLVIRPDKYGHGCLYFAIVNGNAGSRKVNIYKHIVDYHPRYDATNNKATYIGTTTETTAHFKGDYPTMNYSCETKSIDLETGSIGSTATKTITINNGEYIFGEWYGVITGEDSEAFTVSINKNNAFSETATATVSFCVKDKNTTETSYNAQLRLFSPNASTNVESNDIVIPITGSYTGPTTNIEEINTDENISITIENKILTVENTDAETINVYSTTGALIARANNSNTIDLSHLNGVFIVNIKSADGFLHSHKIALK